MFTPSGKVPPRQSPISNRAAFFIPGDKSQLSTSRFRTAEMDFLV
jgi:hypothetical protein